MIKTIIQHNTKKSNSEIIKLNNSFCQILRLFTSLSEVNSSTVGTTEKTEYTLEAYPYIIHILSNIVGMYNTKAVKCKDLIKLIDNLERKYDIEKFEPVLDRERVERVEKLRQEIFDYNLERKQDYVLKFISSNIKQLPISRKMHKIYDNISDAYNLISGYASRMRLAIESHENAIYKNNALSQLKDIRHITEKMESLAPENLDSINNELALCNYVWEKNVNGIQIIMDNNVRDAMRMCDELCDKKKQEERKQDLYNKYINKFIEEDLPKVYEDYIECYRRYIKAYHELFTN